MKIIGVIPARYKSSRFSGKPLADIGGKPMIWWVYQQVIKVPELNDVYVATDDYNIEAACKKYEIPVVMTSESNPTPLNRIHEFSNMIDADWYVCVNGDEPMIEPEAISAAIDACHHTDRNYSVVNCMTTVTNPIEVVDFTNLKIVTNKDCEGIYISRSPIPYPKGTLEFVYKKYVGITCLTKPALDFYANTARGLLEITEDNDLLRFIENKWDVKFVDVDTHSLSVDTVKDLEAVRKLISSVN